MPGPLPETYSLPFGMTGFNHNPNIDEIPPTSLVYPSRNMNLNKNGAESRGGTSKVDSAAYGGAEVMGGYDYTLADETQFRVVVTTDGKIWKDTTTTIHTGWTAGKYVHFEVMNFELYICNGLDIPQIWDGAAGSTSNLTNVPTDWTGANYPQVMILHGKGASERLWAFGVASKPNVVYASKLNDGTLEANFSDANVIIIPVGPGVLTGGVEFGDRLIVFDRLRSYVIDDTDANSDNWGYQASQFKSGLGDFKLVVKTENDIVCMQEDGTIYSVTAVQSYGDYKMASITKPAYIDEWIREYIDLTQIDKFHMQFDPTLRCIKVFMVYKGDTEVKMALPYFIDKGVEKGWGPPHDNKNYASGYDATCSFIYRVSAGSYKIYTGDPSGNVWQLETANKNDDSNALSAWTRTPRLTFENARLTKRYIRGYLLTKAAGNYSITLDITVYNSAGKATTKSTTVSLNSGQAVWGSVTWGSFTWTDADAIIDQHYRINRIGKRIQFDFYNNNADEPFFLSVNLTDFKYLGARVA